MRTRRGACACNCSKGQRTCARAKGRRARARTHGGTSSSVVIGEEGRERRGGVTFQSSQHSSRNDFILAKEEYRRACLDCKECVVPQHKLVVADFRFRIRVHRGKRAKNVRVKTFQT
jgi:hypothetical protein